MAAETATFADPQGLQASEGRVSTSPLGGGGRGGGLLELAALHHYTF